MSDDGRTFDFSPLAWLFVGGLVLGVAGCSFDGGFGGAECEQEGATEDGRVCRGGYWVATDAGPADGAVTDACTPSEERCNGRDDDCDGAVDEGCSCDDWSDQTEGVCSLTGTIGEDGTCQPPSEYVEEEGGGRKCNDNFDNDCDGELNENCACSAGETQPCYTGPAETRGVGVCQEGTQSCDSGGWGDCQGEVVPTDETGERCGNGKDDDCDGTKDEGCGCNYEGKAKGICAGQTREPNGNCPQPEDYQQPTDDEKCDGRDNDCDGATDEGCSCNYDGKKQGICGNSKIGPDGECKEPAEYIERTDDESLQTKCDGADNDCDGETDEGCRCNYNGGGGQAETQKCYSGPKGSHKHGICSKGRQTCQPDGTWGPCKNEQTPEREECGDDEDSDCDGVDSEGCSCNYDQKADGVCQGQVRASDGTCPKPTHYESDESTCDQLDNDCDGEIDEGLDSDGDGVVDCEDSCPNDGDKKAPGICGCGISDVDSDGDGTADCNDGCPNDPDKKSPGVCGCQEQDIDSDGDGTLDCNDECPNDASKTEAGACGCGNDDTDSDGDGTADCNDECENDPSKTEPKVCGCGTDDVDGDGDGFLVCNDCDDTKSFINPDAAPNEMSSGCFKDEDGDDFGDANPPSGVDPGTDCNDSDPGVRPDKTSESSCSDTRDNDCDGKTDFEDLDCKKTAGATCTGDKQCLSGACGGGSTCQQTIFVTSRSVEPGTAHTRGSTRFSSVGGADDICQEVADNAGLPGTWQAVISNSSNSASSRANVTGEVYNRAGSRVASDFGDMWDDQIDAEIRFDENGGDVGQQEVWTGTESNGTSDSDENCSNWGSNGAGKDAETGLTDQTDSDWVARSSPGPGSSDLRCDEQGRLYCIDGQ